MAARHEEGCFEKLYLRTSVFLFTIKGYRAITSSCQGGTVFHEKIRPGAGFKAGYFVKGKLVGLT